MRLDKYLKVSRLIKRRTVANEACDDVIEITLGSKSVKVKVTDVKEVVRKEDAATMYEAVV